jgi:hypothetical protein
MMSSISITNVKPTIYTNFFLKSQYSYHDLNLIDLILIIKFLKIFTPTFTNIQHVYSDKYNPYQKIVYN